MNKTINTLTLFLNYKIVKDENPKVLEIKIFNKINY